MSSEVKRAICVTSGGGDSITNGLVLLKQGYEVHFLHIPHAQKAEGFEKQACENVVRGLKDKGYNCNLHIVEQKWLGELGGSSLTDYDKPAPDGFADLCYSTISGLFTPARNVVLLAVAASLAERIGAEVITLGCNQSESKQDEQGHILAGYPDNTKEFLGRFTAMLEYGCFNFKPKVVSPEWELDKVGIYKWGIDNGFGWVYDYTCSCDTPILQNGTWIHCSRCGCDRNRQMVFFILQQMYPGDDRCIDRGNYYDKDWFFTELLPIYVALHKAGHSKPIWFDKYFDLIQKGVKDAK